MNAFVLQHGVVPHNVVRVQKRYRNERGCTAGAQGDMARKDICPTKHHTIRAYTSVHPSGNTHEGPAQSPDAAISIVPHTRTSSTSVVLVCQSPATWIIRQPGHAARARV
jgi:hypothetical protein